MSQSHQERMLVKLRDSDLEFADENEDVRGRRVLDFNGETLGEVDALLVDEREGKVRFLRVASGGFLGIGREHTLIPVDAITRIDDRHVHIRQTREKVAGAPEYDPTLTAKQHDDYWRSYYGYYGYTPFWTPGYMYPGYPYYRA